MPNVTEKDIIAHLKEKISFHNKEVKRIENLLSAFTGSSDQPKTGKVKAEAATETALPIVETGKKATKAKAVKEVQPKKEAKQLVAPESYSDGLTINEKIALALMEIGSGFNEDIAKAMAQYQPQTDEKKISKQISGVLSTLKSKGRLTSVKEGRKDKYSLPA